MSETTMNSELDNCLTYLESRLQKFAELKAKHAKVDSSERETLMALNAEILEVINDCEKCTQKLALAVHDLVGATGKLTPATNVEQVHAQVQRLRDLIASFMLEKDEVGQALMKLKRGRNLVSAYKKSGRKY